MWERDLDYITIHSPDRKRNITSALPTGWLLRCTAQRYIFIRASDELLTRQLEANMDDPVASIAPMIAFLQPMVEAQLQAGVQEGEAR